MEPSSALHKLCLPFAHLVTKF
uniref:Uncharacterized protein n=1 Tax=Arundo donax TaxID=35708 RepID=A0A0A9ENS3_ARUDO